MIVQFKGETRKQAIVNHFSLDIEDEESFFKYMKEMGYSLDANDDLIESLHNMWDKEQSKNIL